MNTKEKMAKRWDEVIACRFLAKRTTPRIAKAYQSINEDTAIITESTYFEGPVGTGKTMLAIHSVMSICRERYLNNEPRPNFLFVNVSDLFSEIKATYDKNSETTEREVIEKYTNVEILILDDLGIDQATDWAARTLYIIINRLYENLKTVFITSNIPLEKLGEMFPDNRIVRRIDSICNVFELSENQE
jgi:DNA replication protein DnaC